MAKPGANTAFASATLAFLGFFVLAWFMMVAGQLPFRMLQMMPVIFSGAAIAELLAIVLGFKSRHHRLGRLAMIFGIVILLVIGVFFVQGRIVYP